MASPDNDIGKSVVGAEALPIVFILGTGRCGSSLLQEVIARHPAAAFMSNVDDRMGTLGSRNARIYGSVPPRWTRKGRARFAPSEGYRLLDQQVSPIMYQPVRDLVASDVTPWLRQRLTRVFVSRFNAQRGQIFVHKFTGWPRAGLLKEVFPKARFVHVVRDGRAVANSLSQTTWWRGHEGPNRWRLGPLSTEHQAIWEYHDRSFIALAGLYWRRLMEAHELAQQRASDTPGTWTTLRYEDLVADPHSTLSSTLRWMGLDWNTTFARRIAQQPFSNHRTDAFKSDLTSRQLKQLEDVTWPVLQRYGYRTTVDATQRDHVS